MFTGVSARTRAHALTVMHRRDGDTARRISPEPNLSGNVTMAWTSG